MNPTGDQSPVPEESATRMIAAETVHAGEPEIMLMREAPQ